MAGAWRRSRWLLARNHISRNNAGGVAGRHAQLPSSLERGEHVLKAIRTAIGGLTLAIAMLSSASLAHAHDASAYGGLFRSRNLGAWLNADVGLFLGAALTVAVDPRDPNHLLMGTDIGLLASRNGGRSWSQEAPGLISGSVFAIAFSPDGENVMCAAPTGVFRLSDGRWSRAAVPKGAAPAREIAFGSAPDRIYLLGDRLLFISKDRGQSFRRVGPVEAVPITALAVAIMQPTERLFAVIEGRLVASGDSGNEWQQRAAGLGGDPIDTVVLDRALPNRLWAASADRIFVGDDLGARWRPVGLPLPEASTNVRGIAADETASTIVVTTHRGMYRSDDGGQNWVLKENSLPAHLEAGPLVRDPTETRTLYAGYSLLPFPELWRAAVEGRNLLSRLDPVSLAGSFAFIALLIIGGVLLVGWLDRQRSAGPSGSRRS